MKNLIKKTKKAYEKYLNGLDIPAGYMLIGGKWRTTGYGTALRRHDPIAFEVGYQEYARI